MYLIDGNNVIGGRVGWHKDKKKSRRKLLSELIRFSRAKSVSVTVVFDGRPDSETPDDSIHGGVQVYYAVPGSDADSRIVDLVEASQNKHNMIVVTSDMQLSDRIRVCAVQVLKSGQFRNMLDEVKPPKTSSLDSDKPEIECVEIGEWMRYFGTSPEDDDN